MEQKLREECERGERSLAMFTGLIEAVCDVKSVSPGAAAGGSLVVDLGELARDCRTGDSIAVSGVCLTVTRLQGTVATFGLSPETLERSSLASLRPVGKSEYRAGDEGRPTGSAATSSKATSTASARSRRSRQLGEFADIEFAVGPELLDQMVLKGSVAVDGVSLTIAGIGPGRLSRRGDSRDPEQNHARQRIYRWASQYRDGYPRQDRPAATGGHAAAQQPLTVERLRQMGF